MRAFRVVAYLAGPYITGGDPIHLDALLASVWIRRQPGSGGLCRNTPLTEQVHPRLPLARVSCMGARVWAASAARPLHGDLPAMVCQIRKPDGEDWDRLDRTVNTQAGPRKHTRTLHEARVAWALEWLGVGAPTEVRRSLRYLWGPQTQPYGQVGSVRRSGAGQLLAWTCVWADHDTASTLVCAGRVMRHLPANWLVPGEHWVRSGAVEPPYWHPEGQRLVVAVGERGELTQAVSEAAQAVEVHTSIPADVQP